MTGDKNSDIEAHGDENYSDYYRDQEVKVYPSEFLVRAFLGNYPKHKINKKELVGKKALDLGFGDGRNLPLISDLGMEVYGTEVTQSICELITERMLKQGVKVDARVGRNGNIPFDNNFFDCVVASSSCYYLDPGQKYSDSVNEIARVMKSEGIFIHSVPMPTTFIMENAIDLGDGHMKITQDPYGVRVGSILKQFESPEEIKHYLDPHFTDVQVGSCIDDYWGSNVHLWLVVCRKR